MNPVLQSRGSTGIASVLSSPDRASAGGTVRGGAKLHKRPNPAAQQGQAFGPAVLTLLQRPLMRTWAEMLTKLRRVRLDRPRRYRPLPRIAAAKSMLQKRAALKAGARGVAQLSTPRRRASHWLDAHGRSLAVAPRAPDEFKFGPELRCLARVPAPLVRLSMENL